ncbi:amino acid adenylation domain-containing protein [Paenibacillus oenotherae]|uniref:Amino acid adenylation domain-containing protein n=1 Tax=Paenibacillus oenotherae TaxID=1435645 RepID=A0ABS7D1J0_9BACL|nr:non-ribosomal peptide synthetase [Paenibacillus oenotherae]MBW7473807.1 amino acid adenylation domain-containing protein [Paenibacillus oenotherae]
MMTKADAIQKVYPLTPMQEGMLFHSLMDQTSSAYFTQMEATLAGNVDPELFEQSLNHIIGEYDILRTVFVHQNLQRPRQVVFHERKTRLHYEDLRTMAEEEQRKHVEDFNEENRRRGFQLSKDVLVRVALFRVEERTYRLVWSHHHILLDGWGFGVVISRLFQLYAALRNNEAIPPNTVYPYSEYVKWLEKRSKEDSLAYWRSILDGYEAQASLPGRLKGAEEKEYRQEQCEFIIDQQTTEQLSRMARGCGTTLNSLFQAVWAVLLGKYNMAADVVFGSVVSGRPSEVPDIESMVGLFINAVPVRVKMEGVETFAQLLSQIHASAVEMEAHSYLPLYEVQNQSELKQALLDHIIIFENYPLGKDAEGQSAEEAIGFQAHVDRVFEQTNYDLNVVVSPGDELSIKFSYNSNRFDASFVNRVEGHLRELFAQILDNPAIELPQLEVVAAEEKHLLTEGFNATNKDYAESPLIHELFEKQAASTPSGTAVIGAGGELTYSELNREANRLAWTLREKGAAGRVVAVLAERSLDMAVALLAALKAGAAYVPIDPEYPEERIAYLLEDSGACIVLAGTSFLSLTEGKGVLAIDLGDRSAYAGNDGNLPLQTGSDDLAYIIYTSGTTGKPKGVMIEHRSIANTLLWRKSEYGFGPGDRTLLFLSFAFDAFVSTFFAPLISGSAVVFAKDEEAKDPQALKALIAGERITHFSTVPAMFQAILDAITPEEAGTLKAVTLGGEKLSERIAARAAGIHPGLELVNEYGPTENSVITTCLRHIEDGRPITIGSPIANTRVWILGADLRLQPLGAVGELCISGTGLARGYWNRPELTAEAFVPHPYAEGERLYRTGDLARWTADGELEFVERADHQVKIRGYRIELGEIEALLRKQDAIEEAVVLAVQDGSGTKQLCAYVTVAEGGAWHEAALRAALRAELPAYMSPAFIIRMDELPLTTNGKIDRKALPSPESGSGAKRAYTAPGTLLEAKLAPIWQEILQVERVGVKDDFFELGGHSLKAMTLVTRLKKELQAEVPLKTLFQRPTIRAIARYIEGDDGEYSDFVEISPAEPSDTYPVSSGQRRMYVMGQFENVGTAYNMPDALLLEGPIQRDRLASAFQALIARHEPLRTSFEMAGEEPVQRIHASAELHIEYMEAAGREEADRLVEAFIRPFQLDSAPLMRVGLVRLEEEQHLLLLDLHHIIADGVSIGLLIRDMAALYRGEPLPELAIQYKDYAVWQSGGEYAEQVKKDEAFWLKQFADGVPAVDLPTDYSRPLVRDFAGARYEFTAGAELTRALRELSATEGATLFMVLLAAYNVLLAKYSGQEDFVVGTPSAGRGHDDVREMAGLFVNTLALRSRPRPELAFRQFVAEVKEHCLDAFGHGEYPFEELVGKLGLTRDMSRNPLFDTMFLMQNMDKADLYLEDLKLSAYPQSNDIAKFDLTFGAIEQEDETLLLSIEYATALYSPATAERLARHYVQLLEAVTADPAATLAELDMLNAQEKEQLLTGFNDTEAAYPQDATLVSLFQQQAVLRPQSIAVSYDDIRLTYGELNARANVLARKLRDEAGVCRDDLVAILLDRSADMVVAMLAVLKAGGAYVPIDPAYPEDRIRFIMEDSRTKAVLTAEAYLALAGTGAGTVLNLDEGSTFQGDTGNLETVNEPHDLAYIIYTSGTTGRPKGVMISHRNVVRLLINDRLAFRFDEKDVWTMFHSYCFDFSVWEMYGALLYGGHVVVVPRLTAQNPQDFAGLLRREGVTVLNQTPTAFYALIHEETGRQDSGLALRYVIFGGEALNPAMLRPYYSKYPGTKLINMYGITETTVHVTYKEITEQEIASNVSNIGKPIPTLTCYIFDPHGRLVPIGVAGELYVGGDGVARGYLNREELTAERFVPNPYKPAERLYRTGDLARRMASGEMEYLGRIDHQVKIRGHRIELGEIETVLLRHDSVRETIVIARDDENGGGNALCAYVVADVELTVMELREFTKASLPDYMVPAHFIQLQGMPLTSNGKIDRRALPEPDRSMASGTAYSAPQSIREELLADIWQGVLGAPRVGIDDNFFALGGDSIKAIQVAARLGAHGLKLEMKDLFQYPTVGELAARLKSAVRPIDQGAVEGEAALTPIQHWFFQQGYTDAHHWNQSVMLYSPERFDGNALRQALDAIVRHHDALRFVFRSREDGSMEAYNRGPEDGHPYGFHYVDLTGETDDQSALARHAEQLQSSIVLSQGPLLQTAHYRTREGDHLLLIAHHLVIDGVSWRILFEDLEQAYGQALGGEPIVLPLKTDSFLYWSEQLRQYAASPLLLREADYWRGLQSAGAGSLPRDMEAGRGRFSDLRTAGFELSPEETDHMLKEAGRAYNTEINDLLLTALGLAVKEWSGMERVCVNLESHGREQIAEALDISRTVGWFTSQYPIVLDMGAAAGDLSRQIKLTKEQLRAVPNKGIGYDILKYMTPKDMHDLRFELESDICFNYLGQIDGDVANETFRSSHYDNGSPVSASAENSFAWNFGGIVEDGRLSMKCHYNSLAFKETTMERFMNIFRSQLTALIAHCVGHGDSELTPSDVSSKGITMDEMDDIFELLGEKLN